MNAEKLIRELNLLPHPEGGYYRETYRSAETIQVNQDANRNVCTAIYFLLTGNDKSNFHRIQSDELWFFHQGEPLEVVYIQNGKINVILLGNDFAKGEVAQCVIPSNTWFASKIRDSKGYSLVSCTVSPGFDFNDFELGERKNLVNEFPHIRERIIEFTREEL